MNEEQDVTEEASDNNTLSKELKYSTGIRWPIYGQEIQFAVSAKSMDELGSIFGYITDGGKLDLIYENNLVRRMDKGDGDEVSPTPIGIKNIAKPLPLLPAAFPFNSPITEGEAG